VQQKIRSIVEMHAVKDVTRIDEAEIEMTKCLDSEASPATLKIEGMSSDAVPDSSLVFKHTLDGLDGSKVGKSRSPARFESRSSFMSLSMSRLQSCTSTSSRTSLAPEILCAFQCTSPAAAPVWVRSAPQKLVGRMREKVIEYQQEGKLCLPVLRLICRSISKSS
jgi:hypothetical protein